MLHVIIVNNALKVIVSSSLFATQFLLELCRSGTWAPCAGGPAGQGVEQMDPEGLVNLSHSVAVI